MRKTARGMSSDRVDRPEVRSRESRARRRRYSAAFPLLLGILLICGQVQAQRPTEYQVKAAFLYNFGKYVRWPEQPAVAPGFEICLMGSDPFGSVLDNLVHGERIDGQPLMVRRIHSLSEAPGCRIAFLGSSENHRLISDLQILSKYPILTVSDIQDFADDGGMIQFVTEGDRIRFIINLEAAERSGLGVSSELLKVAKLVQRDQKGED